MDRSIAIVGAGLSGLIAARTLVRAGCRVRVFDKARGPGGRMATRRTGRYAFDLGAQYFTVRDERVRALFDEWLEAGVVARWHPRLAVLTDGAVRSSSDEEERYVGTPRMSALTRHLSTDLDMEPRTLVTSVKRDGDGWQLAAEGRLGQFDAVLVTAPPEQAVPLLSEAPALARTVAGVASDPCWAAAVVFPEPLALSFDAAFVRDSPLSWVARNASKPGRAEDNAWVLLATSDWSRSHLADAPSEVAPTLISAFLKAAGCPDTPPVFLDAHRWALATAGTSLGVGVLWDSALRIGACGDWCAGLRVEGAVLSGLAAAERIAAELDPTVVERSP